MVKVEIQPRMWVLKKLIWDFHECMYRLRRWRSRLIYDTIYIYICNLLDSNVALMNFRVSLYYRVIDDNLLEPLVSLQKIVKDNWS